jgi:hypothetical protein
MSHSSLNDLYDATEEDLLYGIGLLAQDELQPVPIVCIHYTMWSRDQLSIVRDACRSGVALNITTRPDGLADLHIATHQRLAIQTRDSEHTSVLKAPAWDANLEAISETVVHQFEAERRRLGGYVLLMQTPELEFLTAVDAAGGALLGPIQPRSMPIPTGT